MKSIWSSDLRRTDNSKTVLVFNYKIVYTSSNIQHNNIQDDFFFFHSRDGDYYLPRFQINFVSPFRIRYKMVCGTNYSYMKHVQIYISKTLYNSKIKRNAAFKFDMFIYFTLCYWTEINKRKIIFQFRNAFAHCCDLYTHAHIAYRIFLLQYLTFLYSIEYIIK